MANPDWRPAAQYLGSRLGRATKEQHALAQAVGLPLKAATPGLIAAAHLRDHLAAVLDEPVRPPSFEQLELIEELSGWKKASDPRPQTHAVAHAVIDLLEVRRELEALKAFKPAKGDIAYEWSWWKDRTPGEVDEDRLRLISSIGDDGIVYFSGGGGWRARASRIEILFRAGDDARRQSRYEAQQRLQRWSISRASASPGI